MQLSCLLPIPDFGRPRPIRVSERRGGPPPLDEQTKQAILDFYGDSVPLGRMRTKSANGVTLLQTAHQFGLSVGTVKKIVAARDYEKGRWRNRNK